MGEVGGGSRKVEGCELCEGRVWSKYIIGLHEHAQHSTEKRQKIDLHYKNSEAKDDFR